jgi:flavin reductase (DIM6/NTAB) family NADH-FMN oxidoreductase RutF
VFSTVSAAEFRAACGLFPSGVTIVTRRLNDGRPYGMTVSSFTSVSLDPPLILVCLDKNATFINDLSHGLPIAVNVLSEKQQNLAIRFANKREENRFAGLEWRPGWNGVPLLAGVVATFVCAIDRVIEGGDHLILIAAVRDVNTYEGGALVWCQRNYHSLPRPPIAEKL